MLYIIIASAIVIIISYLVGSNMAAVRIAASRGTDINKVGSGNAGSTNILRTFGWRWGLICLAFDAAKGAFSVLTGYLVGLLFSHLGLVSTDIRMDLMCLGVLGAMAGHLSRSSMALRAENAWRLRPAACWCCSRFPVSSALLLRHF